MLMLVLQIHTPWTKCITGGFGHFFLHDHYASGSLAFVLHLMLFEHIIVKSNPFCCVKMFYLQHVFSTVEQIVKY